MTILGTRPEIIRLSRVIPLLDEHADHYLVDTGQNFNDRLNANFFRELRVRSPDLRLNVRAATFAKQVGQILERTEQALVKVRPDRVLILGDTNSGLAAVIARRLGIPVFHMEAGNRCYDDRVPEEINRRVIDHCSSILLSYTERSRENLLREGIEGKRILVIGNPIKQVIDAYGSDIDRSDALARLRVEERGFFLATLHRAENVDDPVKLRRLLTALGLVARRVRIPVICSLHPRTRSKIIRFGIKRLPVGVRFLQPFGFFDFIRLERAAFCVLTDSGTVQEEACLLGVPAVTIRDVTERPETIECGSNMLSGGDPESVLAAVELVSSLGRSWIPPREYLMTQVAEAACRTICQEPGHLTHPRVGLM